MIKVPHHCSYLSLGPDKGTNETEPTEEVARLYEQYGRQGGIIVSPSNVIPESDETQPPHKQAAKYYGQVADQKEGKFHVTMEHPTKEDPKPLEVEVRGYGLGATLVAASSGSRTGSSRLVSEPSLRAG